MQKTDPETLIRDNNRFAIDLYDRLREKDSGNLFFSPYGISSAMGILYAGARGRTEREIAETLHFTLPQKQLHAAFAELTDQFANHEPDDYEQQNGGEPLALEDGLDPEFPADNPDDYESSSFRMHIGNRLWLQNGHSPLSAFCRILRKYYQTEPGTVDFAGPSEQAAEEINAWGEEQTGGRTPRVADPDRFSSLTRMILANTVYFSGSWEEPFSKAQNHDAPFYAAGGKTVKTPMMLQRGYFLCGKTDTVQMLQLDYDFSSLSMLILMPWRVGGLAELENSLTVEALDRWLPVLKEKRIELYLPKFKFGCHFRLGETLAAMGMASALDSKQADLSGILHEKEPLFLDEVLHSASVDVDEKGTEAAAATTFAVGAGLTEMDEAEPFRMDYPFLFLIRDRETDGILFMGRLADPASS